MKNLRLKILWIGLLIFFLLANNQISFPAFSGTDDELLDLIEHKAFDFFWNETNPANGLIKDRAKNFTADTSTLSSIASVGFGLVALCIGDSRGWISSDQAYNRILTTLKTFHSTLQPQSEGGFFYHFLNINTGARWPDPNNEISSIDTTLFLAGALFAGKYFQGTEIETLARQLYEAADWQFMAGNSSTSFVNMGRNATSTDFLRDNAGNILKWNSYSECVLLYFLAIGSPTHPIDPIVWENLARPVGGYAGLPGVSLIYVGQNSLFAHQYPYLWLDLRNRLDEAGIDYFDNSRKATLVNRQFCIDNQSAFVTYGTNSWGITACDGPTGYKSYTVPPTDSVIKDDGTVAPTAPAGSIIFTSTESIACLRNFYDTQFDNLWGKYGFSDAFNLAVTPNFFDSDVIGIDLGAILMAIENYRSGLIWDNFMKISYIQTALQKLNFTSSQDVSPPEPVADLSAVFRRADGSIILTWNAPRDDVGATKYIIRYANQPIINTNRWLKATEISQSLIPKSSGAKETLFISVNSTNTIYFAIKSQDSAGNLSDLSSTIGLSPPVIAQNISLLKGFPNPFFISGDKFLTIFYRLQSEGNITLRLYSLSGLLIKEWNKGFESPGDYKVNWYGDNGSGTTVAAGVYFLTILRNDSVIDKIKIAVIK